MDFYTLLILLVSETTEILIYRHFAGSGPSTLLNYAIPFTYLIFLNQVTELPFTQSKLFMGRFFKILVLDTINTDT